MECWCTLVIHRYDFAGITMPIGECVELSEEFMKTQMFESLDGSVEDWSFSRYMGGLFVDRDSSEGTGVPDLVLCCSLPAPAAPRAESQILDLPESFHAFRPRRFLTSESYNRY